MWDPYELMTYAHVASGTVALVAGTVALIVSKGPGSHAKAGRVFAWGMLLPVVTTLIFMFRDRRPLAIVLAVAVVYFVGTAVLAIRNRSAWAAPLERLLVVIPIAICLLAMSRVVNGLVSNTLLSVPGPLLFLALFGSLALGDFRVFGKRRPPRRISWLKRHLLRMLLAFGFATMALLRIGLKLGVPLVVTVVIPIGLALLAAVLFSRRLDAAG